MSELQGMKKMHSKTNLILVTSLVFTTLLTGCANTAADYEPIVDGPKDALFYDDLAACKNLAEQRDYLNDDTKSEALLGAGLGAVVGAIGGDTGDIVGGTLVGGALSAGGGAWEVRGERKNIVIECMSGRGHRVVG